MIEMIEIRCLAITVLLTALTIHPYLFASEVIEETQTRVVIREHPKTGKPYVSIIPAETPEPPDPFTGQKARILRPDYRMLDPKIKSGKIPYEGPVSDRKKVYIFAASLAALGAAGGALPIAPVAAGSAGASGGAGVYAAAGTAVTAGPAVAATIASKPDSKKGDYAHESEYRTIETGKARDENSGH